MQSLHNENDITSSSVSCSLIQVELEKLNMKGEKN